MSLDSGFRRNDVSESGLQLPGFRWLLPVLMLVVACTARATETDWRMHGFVSQRLTSSTHGNQFFGDTAGRVSADFTEIGAGFSWRPHQQWLLSGQAIYRRGGESETQRIEPDYLYATYTPLESESGRILLKLGKIKVPYGFYGDARDTPMTRPGILAPQSIYTDALRQFNKAAVGVHAEAERAVGNNVVSLRLSQVKHKVDSENTFLLALRDRNQFKGELYSRDNESMAMQLAVDHDGGKWRAALSRVTGKGHYRPGAGDIWTDGDVDFDFSLASLQWNGETVSLTSGYQRSDVATRFQPAGLADRQDIGESVYLQAQWRFAPRWEGILRRDAYFASKADRNGSAYALANPGQPAWSRFAKDWSVGLRYTPDKHWLLAGEVHRVQGTAWLPPADNLSRGWPGNTSERWNLYLLQATYLF